MDLNALECGLVLVQVIRDSGDRKRKGYLRMLGSP